MDKTSKYISDFSIEVNLYGTSEFGSNFPYKA